jgi:hypothetical protein
MDNSIHLNPPSRAPQNPRPPERREAQLHRACRSRKTPTTPHPTNKGRPFPTQTPAFAPPPTRRHPERRQAQLHRACRSRRTPKPPHPTDAPRPFPTQIPPEPSLLEPFITKTRRINHKETTTYNYFLRIRWQKHPVNGFPIRRGLHPFPLQPLAPQKSLAFLPSATCYTNLSE